jgi:hypothetical protein
MNMREGISEADRVTVRTVVNMREWISEPARLKVRKLVNDDFQHLW